MTEKVHGHEVMEMMISSQQAYTKQSLCAAILQKYGEHVRFHTCSKDNMTAQELVEFLAAKGKFIDTESGFTTAADKMCNH